MRQVRYANGKYRFDCRGEPANERETFPWRYRVLPSRRTYDEVILGKWNRWKNLIYVKTGPQIKPPRGMVIKMNRNNINDDAITLVSDKRNSNTGNKKNTWCPWSKNSKIYQIRNSWLLCAILVLHSVGQIRDFGTSQKLLEIQKTRAFFLKLLFRDQLNGKIGFGQLTIIK